MQIITNDVRMNPEPPHEILVGQTIDDRHFIAVRKCDYEPIENGDERYHAIKIHRDNIEWLIRALKQELRIAKRDAAHEQFMRDLMDSGGIVDAP